MSEGEINVFYTYDHDANVIYINFHNPPLEADGSLRMGPCILRLRNGIVIGVTILEYSNYSSEDCNEGD